MEELPNASGGRIIGQAGPQASTSVERGRASASGVLPAPHDSAAVGPRTEPDAAASQEAKSCSMSRVRSDGNLLKLKSVRKAKEKEEEGEAVAEGPRGSSHRLGESFTAASGSIRRMVDAGPAIDDDLAFAGLGNLDVPVASNLSVSSSVAPGQDAMRSSNSAASQTALGASAESAAAAPLPPMLEPSPTFTFHNEVLEGWAGVGASFAIEALRATPDRDAARAAADDPAKEDFLPLPPLLLSSQHSNAGDEAAGGDGPSSFGFNPLGQLSLQDTQSAPSPVDRASQARTSSRVSPATRMSPAKVSFNLATSERTSHLSTAKSNTSATMLDPAAAEPAETPQPLPAFTSVPLPQRRPTAVGHNLRRSLQLHHDFAHLEAPAQRRMAGMLKMHVIGSVRRCEDALFLATDIWLVSLTLNYVAFLTISCCKRAMHSHIEAGHLDFINEIRPLTCLFIGFPTLLDVSHTATQQEQLGCVQFVVQQVQDVMRKWVAVRGCSQPSPLLFLTRTGGERDFST